MTPERHTAVLKANKVQKRGSRKARCSVVNASSRCSTGTRGAEMITSSARAIDTNQRRFAFMNEPPPAGSLAAHPAAPLGMPGVKEDPGLIADLPGRRL